MMLNERLNSLRSRQDIEQTSDDVNVSIVMITRNRSHLIGDAIRSCLLQTVQSFELLVIDDGSEDDTEEAVKSFE